MSAANSHPPTPSRGSTEPPPDQPILPFSRHFVTKLQIAASLRKSRLSPGLWPPITDWRSGNLDARSTTLH